MEQTNSYSQDFSLIWGAEGIAKELGVPVRRCFYMLESGALSKVARKVGGRWCAERSKLRAFFREGEAA